ncbi:MAG: site-2 protease family protein [Candidatus Thermoplasmatota archaeon]|nr:site-2 protease family protein [Candidatus Thermoplasmatota archaeon]
MVNPFIRKQRPKIPQITSEEIELLKTEVGKHFPFYDFRYQDTTIVFFCSIDPSILESGFESIRKKLSEHGFIPFLRKEHGEFLLYITKKPEQKEKPLWVNIALLITTIVTTILTGSLLSINMATSVNYLNIQELPDILLLFEPAHLINGAVLFSFPLMSILFIHEMGHYFISKKHHLKTSLPFFIPIPPVLPGFNIGTFGALISSHDPMPDKKTLFDVGIAGPLAGFIVAIPVTIIGLITSNPIPISTIGQGDTILGSSLLFALLSTVFAPIQQGFALDLNPIAFAGWIGLLITSINLLPAGQLDGGHIFRAVLGEKQKYAAWVAVFIMIFTGWIFFAILVMFLIGTMHPPPLNDHTELDLKRKLLFFVAVAILILCFIPDPIYIL